MSLSSISSASAILCIIYQLRLSYITSLSSISPASVISRMCHLSVISRLCQLSARPQLYYVSIIYKLRLSYIMSVLSIKSATVTLCFYLSSLNSSSVISCLCMSSIGSASVISRLSIIFKFRNSHIASLLPISSASVTPRPCLSSISSTKSNFYNQRHVEHE